MANPSAQPVRVATAVCLAMLLAGCSNESAQTPTKSGSSMTKQKEALDKARDVSRQLEEAAKKQREASQ